MSDSNSNNDFQDRDIRLKPLTYFLVGTLVVTVAAVAGMKVMFDRLALSSGEKAITLAERAKDASRPAYAVVEGVGEAQIAMKRMRVEMDAVLNHYRWIDSDAGVVQIPIDQAMKRIVEKGLPVRQAMDTAAREQETPVQAGERYFTELGCIACHGAVSGVLGPSLTGAYLREVKLADGTTVISDEAYLRESILQSQAKMVEGYLPVMPVFEGTITMEQLDSLIAYIKTL